MSPITRPNDPTIISEEDLAFSSSSQICKIPSIPFKAFGDNIKNINAKSTIISIEITVVSVEFKFCIKSKFLISVNTTAPIPAPMIVNKILKIISTMFLFL